MKASWSAPGSSGDRRATPASSSRLTFSSRRTLPQVNERSRNEPSVGRRSNRSLIATWRSTSMSSMLSPPGGHPRVRAADFHFGEHASFRRDRATLLAATLSAHGPAAFDEHVPAVLGGVLLPGVLAAGPGGGH